MKLQINGSNLLGFTETSNGKLTFKTYCCRENSANNEIYHQITENELSLACIKAENAYKTYALLPISKRIHFLNDIISLLEENRNILVSQFCKESSLLPERANIELTRTKIQIQTYVDFISKKDWNLSEQEETNGVLFEKRLFPIGPVVVFGASNFPFAYSTIGGDTASALAAGNPVIYKSNPYHAGVSELTARIILQAAQKNGLPDGVFSLIQGKDYWIGEQLIKNENIAAVGFTGSVHGGEALLEYGKQRKSPIPIFCEMGSLNPVFIFQDAFSNRLDEMVDHLSFAIQNDAGQFCTKPGLLFIENHQAEDFYHKMQKKFENASATPMLHPSIYQAFQKLKAPFEQFTIYKNNQGNKENWAIPELVSISFEEFKNSKPAKSEVFGPFSIIVRCKDENEMKQALRLMQGHLTTSFWSNNNLDDEWLHLMTNKVGRIIKNGVSTGVAVIDSMHHGGNFPATSDSRFTAVGKDAIYRFLQPVTLQNFK